MIKRDFIIQCTQIGWLKTFSVSGVGRLRAFQMAKHRTVVYDAQRWDFTNVEHYDGENYFIFQQHNHKISTTNTLLIPNVPGMWACRHLPGQCNDLYEDVALLQVQFCPLLLQPSVLIQKNKEATFFRRSNIDLGCI